MSVSSPVSGRVRKRQEKNPHAGVRSFLRVYVLTARKKEYPLKVELFIGGSPVVD